MENDKVSKVMTIFNQAPNDSYIVDTTHSCIEFIKKATQVRLSVDRLKNAMVFFFTGAIATYIMKYFLPKDVPDNFLFSHLLPYCWLYLLGIGMVYFMLTFIGLYIHLYFMFWVDNRITVMRHRFFLEKKERIAISELFADKKKKEVK